MRVISVENLESLMNQLSKDEIKNHIPKFLMVSIEDKSWKVRQALSKSFAYLLRSFAKDLTELGLFTLFKRLLTDPEPEVQLASLQSLAKSIEIIPSKILEQIAPLF